VNRGEFVVAGGEPAPSLVVVEQSFDDVTRLVVSASKSRGPAASRAARSSVGDLIVGLRDHGLDPPAAQQFAVAG
jgi:hypothetical protein